MVRAKRILAAGLALVAASIAAAGALAVKFGSDAAAARTAVVRALEAGRALDLVYADLADAETGQRGYVLTGRTDYLGPYQAAVRALPGDLAALRSSIEPGSPAEQQVAVFESLISQKLAELDATIAASRAKGFEAARQIVLTDAGKSILDQIRATIRAIADRQSRPLLVSPANRAADDRAALAATITAAVLVLAALGAGGWLLFASLRRVERMDSALAAQSLMLQVTLDTIRDGIAAFDRAGSLTAFNQRFFQLLGFPGALATRGRPLAELCRLDDARDHPFLTRLCAADLARAGSDLENVSLGSGELEVYKNALPDGGFVIVGRDVTARRRAEAELRQSQKMEAIGQITGGVAHDFNNLLQIIVGNLEPLAREIGANEAAQRRLRNVRLGADRGAQLTRQLLAFARRQPLDPKPVNLARLIRDMTELLRRTLGERIEIETVVAGGLWNTLADPHQVENAVLNLGINARDAMPNGGKLTIELSNAALDDAYAAENAEVVPGQYVLLAVTDSGIGMAPAVAARAFEPFFTTKPEGKGTGLGLSMVYGFVKQTGGHVKLYSEVRQGTTVKLYLPRVRSAEERLAARQDGPALGGSERILVVEDDGAVRQTAVDMLAELGYEVLAAETGQQALALLRAGTAVDLLFTDVVMPGPVGGRELARQAQNLIPGLPVLFTSGYTENAIIHHGRIDPGVELLSKPYRQDELARKLRQLLATKNQARPAGSPPSASPLQVLVVDDDALVRMATADMIEELGHQVRQAETAYKALAAIEAIPDLDVLVTDVGMPGMDGHELARAARRLRPTLSVVLATGYTDGAAADTGVLPQTIHLAKPYRIEQLKDALERLSGPRLPVPKATLHASE